MNKRIALSIDLVLAFFLIVLGFLCFAWFPITLSLDSIEGYIGPDTDLQNIRMRITKTVIYSVSLFPILVSILAAFRVSCSFQKGKLFTSSNASRIRVCGILTICGFSSFSVGNIVFLILWPFDFAFELLYLLIGISGGGIGILLLVFSEFVKESTKVKEENELTI